MRSAAPHFIMVHLHGLARKRFGGPYRFDARDPAEVLRALGHQVRGFRDMLRQHDWVLVRGPRASGNRVGTEDLHTGFGGKISELHLCPLPTGAKRAGVGKIALGVALAAVSIGGAVFAAPAGAGIGAALGAEIPGLGIKFASVALSGAAMAATGASSLQVSSGRRSPA